MIWLADDDPIKLQALERMPIVDYWLLLNRKIDAAETALKAQKKMQGHAGNRR